MRQALKRAAQRVLAPVAPLAWRARPAPRLIVLMYHRVLPEGHPDRAIEQPGMYVSPDTLDLHLILLKRHFQLVQLDEWARCAAAGEALPQQACAITFDDGWRDNFEHAFPVLRRHQAPATIFLVSGMTDTALEFWPNRLARTLTRLPDGQPLRGPLGELLAPLVEHARMRHSWSLADLDAAIVLAKQLDESQINAALDDARIGAAPDGRAVLDRDEVRLMAASGLVRFGSHTRSHFRFRGDVSAQVLQEEIHGSLSDIVALAGQACAPVFCYPNGDVTAAAVSEVRRHYIAAVTTRNGWHHTSDDPFLIRRVGMHEDVSNIPSSFLTRLAQLI